jgi:CRP-like cAMP-binding protein
MSMPSPLRRRGLCFENKCFCAHTRWLISNRSFLSHFPSEPAATMVRSFAMSHALRKLGGNRLLGSLGREDRNYLASVSRIEHAPQGRVLTSRSEPGTEVWFPHTGVIALTTTDASGRSVQTGVVGRDGCVGLDALFGPNPALPDATIQIEGSMSVIPAAQFRTAIDARPQVQGALSKFLHGLAAQSLQTIACNRLHTLHARCCRWLLTMQDAIESDMLPLTQEDLATLLGSGRPRVNLLLAALERDGLVRRHRGRVQLLTRRGLEKCACECYRLVRDAAG